MKAVSSHARRSSPLRVAVAAAVVVDTVAAADRKRWILVAAAVAVDRHRVALSYVDAAERLRGRSGCQQRQRTGTAIAVTRLGLRLMPLPGLC